MILYPSVFDKHSLLIAYISDDILSIYSINDPKFMEFMYSWWYEFLLIYNYTVSYNYAYFNDKTYRKK